VLSDCETSFELNPRRTLAHLPCTREVSIQSGEFRSIGNQAVVVATAFICMMGNCVTDAQTAVLSLMILLRAKNELDQQ
jgi:hypothetical protein